MTSLNLLVRQALDPEARMNGQAVSFFNSSCPQIVICINCSKFLSDFRLFYDWSVRAVLCSQCHGFKKMPFQLQDGKILELEVLRTLSPLLDSMVEKMDPLRSPREGH